MKILTLDLRGFKRFGLNNVGAFSISMTEATQLFLGTNGSGKSSLMGELTPLPPDPSAYTKEGAKTITLTHRSSHYKLHSQFSPKAEHSFLRDGVELNEGGTVTFQRDLVKKYFGITQEIHDLLIERERFCSMAPTRRRDWYTKLSDVSYDYALAVFQRLKDRVRDTSGALKLAKRRQVAEVAKVISPEEETKLTRDVAALHHELEVLQQYRAPVDVPAATHEETIRLGMGELARMSMRLLQTRFIAPYGTHPRQTLVRNEWYELTRPGFTSLEDITALIDEYRQEVALKQALIDKEVVEHNKIRETVQILQRTGAEGVKALLARQDAVREERSGILSQLRLGMITPDPTASLRALETVYDQLQAVFEAIPENSERKFSSARLQELEAQIFAAKDARQKKSNELQRLGAERSHVEIHKNSSTQICPKCHHQWTNGYSEAHHHRVLEAIGVAEEEAKVIDKLIVDLQAEQQSVREYAELFRDYLRVQRNWPILTPLWEHLLEGDMPTHAPRRVVPTLDIYRQDLRLEVEAAKCDVRLNELRELVRAAEQVGDASLSEQQERLGDVTLRIEALTSEVAQAQRQQSSYVHYKRELQDAFDLAERIEQLQASLTTTRGDLIESVRRDILAHCIRQIQHTLVRKEETLSAVKLQKGIIADLEQSIARLTVEEEAARSLQRELSPTEGLIAEGLLGFIRNYTGQMNALIRKVWAYPLVIQDCGVAGADGAELDYKFPMMVESKSNIVPDISKGSTGMQEIVNMAFKVTAMQYLKLDEAPIFADEFGGTLDAAHKNSATITLRSLMEQRSFSQLFMVSHDYRQYGSFPNMEVCVLDPRNIVVPETYNQHVSIS